MKLNFFILIELFLFFSFTSVFGEQLDKKSLMALSLEELMQIKVTTATGTEKTLKTIPAVATVITADEIEKLGATTLDQALESVAGLHYMPSGYSYFSSLWSIRGIFTTVNTQILLLINGIPFYDIYGGNPGNSYRMPVAMISRIEIILGPGSAVHGADAFSGTINVITKEASEINGTKTGIRYSSFNTSDIWAQHGGTYKGWDILFSVENQKTDGDKDRIIEQDFLGTGSPSLTPNYIDTWYELTDTHLGIKKENVKMNLYYSMQESSAGPGGIQVITYDNIAKVKILTGDITYNNSDLIENWNLSFRLNGDYRKNDTFFQFYPASYINMQGNPIPTTRDGGFELSGNYSGFDAHNVRIGTGMQYFDLDWEQNKNFGPGIQNRFGTLVKVDNTAYTSITDHHRSNIYEFIQNEWNFAEDWTFTGGIRFDEYNDFGSTTNPRVALVWNTTDTFSTKLLYGEAFRAPSFAEQYLINNPVALGNPNIEPEEIKTYELVFEYSPFTNFQTDLSFYTYEIKGLIEYVRDPLPATTSSAQNNKDQEGYGYEVKVFWDIMERLQLRSNFSHQHSENIQTDYDVHDTPANKFYTDLEWNFYSTMSFVTQYYWIGDRKRAVGDTRPEIADYDLANLILRYKIEESLSLSAGCKNVLDEDAREPSDGRIPGDYPLETRSYFGEVRYNF